MSIEESKSYRDYLAKTFLEELNYKIWSTKGSRFSANKRLLQIARYSNLCLSMLTVYLIAVGLLSVYNVQGQYQLIDPNLIAYSITCLSILLLVFGQIENAKDFGTKAKEFHNCGLELANLYNELRIYKTLTAEQTLEEKKEFAETISRRYQQILEKHHNHDQIDNNIFRSKRAAYHELTKLKVLGIKIEYYCRTLLIYHLLIVIPPVVIITFLIIGVK